LGTAFRLSVAYKERRLRMNHSPKKILFHAFRHRFNRLSTGFQHLSAAFRHSSLFFVFGLKLPLYKRNAVEACLSLRAAESDLHHLRGQDKPNPKGILGE
jgi:hypothetical protein